MLVSNVISSFKKLSLQVVFQPTLARRSISTNHPLLMRTTPCLFAEPLKKKKRVDPAVERAREDRKKKKLEKQIRKLEKSARQLKPIEECEVSLTLIDTRKQRERPPLRLSDAEVEERIAIEKQWSQYRHKQHVEDAQMLDRIMYSQQRALDELRKESEELYQEAIQVDSMLLPYKSEGPANTPPIENYDSPDGDYKDISKKWN